jgi:hypothetical protein
MPACFFLVAMRLAAVTAKGNGRQQGIAAITRYIISGNPFETCV